MSKSDSFSRRAFVAAASAMQAASTATAQGRRPVTSSDNAASAGRVSTEPIRVVTTYKFEPHEIEKIQKAAGDVKVDIVICNGREEYRQKLRDAEVVYGGIGGADLDFAPKLKWVQWGGAGVEGMDERLKSHSAVVTNYARTFAHGITETGMGMLLSLTRGITKYYYPAFTKRQMVPVGTVKSDHHQELTGLTMGIVGFGGIGSLLARRAYYGFDMKIVATDAKPVPAPEYVELHDPSYFMKMVPRVDVLVSAAPSTAQTRGMFNESVFRAMKKSAYFLALSRGDLFDDMALVKALKEGWIAGAGLDVFPQEPPPSTHPIFDCTNVVMTAHSSGWSTNRQVRLIDLFADNVRRYAEGIALVNVVDKAKGY